MGMTATTFVNIPPPSPSQPHSQSHRISKSFSILTGDGGGRRGWREWRGTGVIGGGRRSTINCQHSILNDQRSSLNTQYPILNGQRLAGIGGDGVNGLAGRWGRTGGERWGNDGQWTGERRTDDERG
jgi:hypothetical protein